jgi:transcriptional regulator with XRE-family HTH domain
MAVVLDRLPSEVIGETVRRYRRENNLTQKELAKQAALTQAAISQIENGKRSGLESLRKLCSALNKDLAQLFAEATREAEKRVSESIREGIQRGEDEGWLSPEKVRQDLGND